MDKRKPVFSTELAYFLGVLALALGTALTERSDCGVSMVVAPAYLLHLKLCGFFPFFTFGVAEFCLQVVLIAVIALAMGRFKLHYLFCFVTVVFYSLVLDRVITLLALIPDFGMVGRIAFFVSGTLVCALGVSLLFHTYIAPPAYDFFVKELSGKFGIDINRFKTIYDLTSCLIAILLSFAFFGLWHFEGIGPGTVICAICNGWIIGRISKALERRYEFRDSWKLRKYFE